MRSRHRMGLILRAPHSEHRNYALRTAFGCSRYPAFVVMVQAAQLSKLDNASVTWRLRSSWFGSVFGQCQMGAPPMIIFDVSGKVLVHRPLAEHDHMIQALAADRADEAFDVGPLPWGPRR